MRTIMTIPLRRLLQTTLLLILAPFFLHGCAGHQPRYPQKEQAGPKPEQTLRTEPQKRHDTIDEKQREPEERLTPTMKPRQGPAQAVFHDAEKALAKGDYNQAEMLLERALRVEPRNGWYWHAMARVKFAQGSVEQTIQFCRKSNSLAGQDTDLQRNNRVLLKKASQKTDN